MYTNIFDTVRTSPMDQHNMVGTLYTAILSGMHPTLSLNQAVDNITLINLCLEHPEVLKLIRDGRIRIAAYRTYQQDGHDIDPILGYLRNALAAPKPGKYKSPFTFSSLPFLEKYSNEDIWNIFKWMDGLLSGTQVYATPSVVLSQDFQQSGDYERIRKQLEVIKQIQAAAFGNYLSPSDTPLVNNTLPHRLQYAGKKLQESADPVQPGFLAGVNELLGYLSANSGDTERTGNRSHLYKVICELDRSGQHTAELKELVDLCYNEVVAASLCDNEKDIMSASAESSNIGIYVRNEDQDHVVSGQKFELINRKSVDDDLLSWEKLDSVLTEADARMKAQDWKGNMDWKELMEDILWKHEIKSIKLAGKQFATGSLTFLPSVAGLHEIMGYANDNTLTSAVKMTLIGATALSGWAIFKDSREKVTNGISAIKDARSYAKMQDQLVQTNYLRRDYAEQTEE